jgi:DNA-binding cell septation regulator SpoVG
MKNLIEKISVKTTKNNPKLLAIVTLHMTGNWSIKGYMVRNDNNGLWVSAPQYKRIGTEKWSPLVWIDSTEWKEVQQMILYEFDKEVNKKYSFNSEIAPFPDLKSYQA